MFIKKCLPMYILFLLFSNGLMQSMDIIYNSDDSIGTVRLKEYDAFVDALKHEKYELNDVKWTQLSLNQLIDLAADSPDTRYLKKLMEYPVYAHFIKSKGLALWQDYLENKHTKNVRLLLDAGADINAVLLESSNISRADRTLLGIAVLRTTVCYGWAQKQG